ncbi:hypothetical protein [Mameliella alba]|uniref:hypothetical protein n=1 Tax=Mameliella alba TaxID=561184 RepID=UPI0020954D76|nr:hypothetical protein [Mameliella alba]
MPDYSMADDALAELPTVFAPELFKGQVVLMSGEAPGSARRPPRSMPGWEPTWRSVAVMVTGCRRRSPFCAALAPRSHPMP